MIWFLLTPSSQSILQLLASFTHLHPFTQSVSIYLSIIVDHVHLLKTDLCCAGKYNKAQIVSNCFIHQCYG